MCVCALHIQIEFHANNIIRSTNNTDSIGNGFNDLKILLQFSLLFLSTVVISLFRWSEKKSHGWMKTAIYLLNHQSFGGSIRRRVCPLSLCLSGQYNFFLFFAKHGIGHLVAAPIVDRGAIQCDLRGRSYSLCVRQMVYLPPVDMQCDSIFHA